jgi:hypothetical protein
MGGVSPVSPRAPAPCLWAKRRSEDAEWTRHSIPLGPKCCVPVVASDFTSPNRRALGLEWWGVMCRDKWINSKWYRKGGGANVSDLQHAWAHVDHLWDRYLSLVTG